MSVTTDVKATTPNRPVLLSTTLAVALCSASAGAASAQGFEYNRDLRHWSFVAPRRPPLPETGNADWASNAIDSFVLARLERHALQPSAAADNTALLRRVTLDLTGLPPTLDEVNQFQRDCTGNSQSAVHQLVDRLLASPRFGERMALAWLDAARYADTNGYFTDNQRTMWRWRDWVIGAFNRGMPFDQFTIEQLAGDLLPGATIEQRIATGFNRNHMVNNETGIIEEEFRVEYVADRVDTTATVWMGLTLGCARCHDHKYDPVSQKEYYRFFSLFNNVPERGLSGSSGNATPLLTVPTARQQARLDALRSEVARAEKDFSAIQGRLEADQTKWERTAVEHLPEVAADGLAAHYDLESPPSDGSTLGPVAFVVGMIGGAAKFDGDACVTIPADFEFDRGDAFSYGAWIRPSGAGCVVSKIDDARDLRGFDVVLRKGQQAASQTVAALRGEVAAELVRGSVDRVLHHQKEQKSLETLLEKAYRALPDSGHVHVATITGIGLTTAAVMVAKIVSIDRFQTAGQLVGYFGVFPEEHSSGVDRQGRPAESRSHKMSAKGNDLVRRYLWNAALSAIQHNPAVRALYRRLRARGTRGDVAMGHCMRKLLHLVFAVWNSNRPFDKNHYPWEQPQRSPQANTDEEEKAAGHKGKRVPDRKVVTAASGNVADHPPQVKTPDASTAPADNAKGAHVDYAYLREQLTIERVLRRLNALGPLHGTGPQRRGPCPIHGAKDARTRSFSVNLARNVFQCFHSECRAAGNVLDLWAAATRLPLYDAALDLAANFDLQLSRNREEEPVCSTASSNT